MDTRDREAGESPSAAGNQQIAKQMLNGKRDQWEKKRIRAGIDISGLVDCENK
jgi:hypothetical protein